MKHQVFLLPKAQRTLQNSDELLEAYAEAKQAVVTFVNTQLNTSYDLMRWVESTDDPVAWFLNEAGSNCLTHSKNKYPTGFQVWLTPDYFILGIKQADPYSAVEANAASKGAGFAFYRNTPHAIFFDHPTQTKQVFLLVKLHTTL